MKDLQALKTELTAKLKAKQGAEGDSEMAQELFVIAMNELLEANPEVAALKTAADQAKIKQAETKQVWNDARVSAATELADYFEEKPEDKEVEPAFSFRLEKSPSWVCAENQQVNALINAGATFLLAVDHKAVSTFVKSIADKQDDVYHMPSKILSWLPELSVETVTKPTISDKNLTESK